MANFSKSHWSSLKNKGFTIIELLIVSVILGILALVALANFRSAQWKARDNQRKTDLHQIQEALNVYLQEHGTYPPAETDEGGKINACSCTALPTLCIWQSGSQPGGEFCDVGKTVYMQAIPGDPTGNPPYCYWSNGTSFKIYAKLENKGDPEIKGPYACGGDLARYDKYNFGLSSSNISL